jgi:exopolysaccharide biosynthesis polyprenyl glycosylphosphotransferase
MKRTWLIVFGDFVSFLVAFIFLILIRFNKQDYSSVIDSHMIPFLYLYIIWAFIFYIFGLYNIFSIKPTISNSKRWVTALLSSFVVGILLFYFVPFFGITPKFNLLIQVVIFGIFSYLLRRIIYKIFSNSITQPTLIVGNSLGLLALEKIITKNPQIGLRIIKHFKNINEVNLDYSKAKNVIIILDKSEDTLDNNIITFYKNGVDIIDTARAYEKYLYKIPVDYIDISFIIENVHIGKNYLYTYIIRAINVIFSLLVLVFTSPLLIISSIFIYLHDKGPIFYTQERVGLNGKVFKLIKLRSMIIDSEKNGAMWCTGQNDSRVTPIGRIIRKLHIDEIPQMINILKGDISLVGPRPERPEFVNILSEQIPYYSLRHIVRPGFTGWAQIKYRYANTVEDSKEKFEYDLYYIKNRNVFLDLEIISKTIRIIFTH